LIERRLITGSWEGSSYVPPYGRYIACRIMAMLTGQLPTKLDKEIKQLLEVERSTILRAQGWDGSWESPQATALNLSTLLTLGVKGVEVDRAALYLTETQQVMGCWRSEELWLTPGPGVYPTTYYESVPVTTALCLRTLALWKDSRKR